MLVETQGVGPSTYTVKLGVAGDDATLLAASDLLAVINTRYAILLTKALTCNAGLNVRLTMVDAANAATAGKFRISILWKIDGRMEEVYTT